MRSKYVLLILIFVSLFAGCQPTNSVSTPVGHTPSPISSTSTPVNSSPWIEEEISFSFGSNELFGILTLPPGEGPYPAIVIISGSVNQTTGVRDGVSARYQVEHARRMVLDDYAVLRYDPPGVGRSTGEAGFEPLDQRSEEAIAALHFLQSRDEIISDKVGLWGISQGAWVVSMTAANYSQDVAFIIPVSGAGVSVAEQQVHSIEFESRNAKFSEEDITKAVLIGRLLIDWQLENPIFKESNITDAQILGNGPWTSFLELVYDPGDITPSEGFLQVIDILQSIRDESWTQFLYLNDLYLPSLLSIPPEEIETLRALSGPSLLVNPKEYMISIRCPVMAIFGELDLLQPSERSAALFEQYLTEAGNDDFKIVTLLGEGHSTFISKLVYWDLVSSWLGNLY